MLLGNHRDAWVFGAIDPSSGTAAMMELSRVFGSMVKKGKCHTRYVVENKMYSVYSCIILFPVFSALVRAMYLWPEVYTNFLIPHLYRLFCKSLLLGMTF